jgi:MFS family permease
MTKMMKKPEWLSGNVFFLGLVSLLSDASHEMATAVLPFFLTLQLGYSAAVLGLIEGFSDGASSFVKPFSGYLSDRLGRRKPPINLGYALTGLLIPAIGFASNWVQIAALRVGGWVGRGARGGPRDALLADSVDSESHGRAFGFHRAMDTIGATIGPALALLLITSLGYREIFYITSLPGIAAFVVVVLFVKEVRQKQDNDPTQRVGFVGAVRTLPNTFKLFLTGVGLFGVANFANSLFALRAQQVFAPALGTTQATLVAIALYTLLNLVYATACFPIGALGDRIGKRPVLVAGYFLSAVTCFGTAYLTADLLYVALVFAAAGIFTATTETIEGAFAADLLPSEVRGTGYGVLQTINGIGDFVSSAIVGVLWIAFSPVVAFEYSAILSAVGALVLFGVTRHN